MAIKNILLIHGAWADGSGWSRVVPAPVARDYAVTAPRRIVAVPSGHASIVSRADAAADLIDEPARAL